MSSRKRERSTSMDGDDDASPPKRSRHLRSELQLESDDAPVGSMSSRASTAHGVVGMGSHQRRVVESDKDEGESSDDAGETQMRATQSTMMTQFSQMTPAREAAAMENVDELTLNEDVAKAVQWMLNLPNSSITKTNMKKRIFAENRRLNKGYTSVVFNMAAAKVNHLFGFKVQTCDERSNKRYFLVNSFPPAVTHGIVRDYVLRGKIGGYLALAAMFIHLSPRDTMHENELQKNFALMGRRDWKSICETMIAPLVAQHYLAKSKDGESLLYAIGPRLRLLLGDDDEECAASLKSFLAVVEGRTDDESGDGDGDSDGDGNGGASASSPAVDTPSRRPTRTTRPHV
ncbi:uncharacterized protein AMSG_00006 [Thecamonas trahens ATCC 50062]|uniref:MAGE domain-containing protein n=1 Tax=Thecamonas trahens ATCC 50062 TaxID=461836 RepID=A0A0L0D3L3_THETB|nr:hypothetical protein AMSG_00006 [Thecamonas trahens ATCC 50062]KNC45893.1 hypothetical protein AMSG_00006 [Thecamonas trahens ATCC 50062]|eukprot:XP_013762882.1 hypothetical protein AMSG_00006 [Thecamonas trahens ATCC 50062]